MVGGGSTYTPELVDGIARLRDEIEVDELVLCDPDPTRLDAVAGVSRRIASRHGWRGNLTATADLAEAVDGADFVLLQLRIGGQAARHLDETIPLRCGCVGQETTGAGGFAKALRTVPVVLDIADEVRRRAASDAWIIDFTNPVGIVTRSLLDHGHRAIGLCNVAIGFQLLFASWLGVDATEVRLGHAGLNHLTWIRSVDVGGDDVLPRLIEEHGEQLADRVGMPLRLLHSLGAIPSYYLRYFYQHDVVVGEQRGQRTRAEEVIDIERQLLEIYRDPSVDTKPELLDATRRRVLQRGCGATAGLAVERHGRCPGRRCAQQRRTARAARRRGRRGPVRHQPFGCDAGRLVRDCTGRPAGSSARSPPTSGSPPRRRSPATARPRSSHCSPIR